MLETDILVLIVAKCIVNIFEVQQKLAEVVVLIVAKCIVNEGKIQQAKNLWGSINSSKVYCKC